MFVVLTLALKPNKVDCKKMKTRDFPNRPPYKHVPVHTIGRRKYIRKNIRYDVSFIARKFPAFLGRILGLYEQERITTLYKHLKQKLARRFLAHQKAPAFKRIIFHRVLFVVSTPTLQHRASPCRPCCSW